jgi:hypothetical protein
VKPAPDKTSDGAWAQGRGAIAIAHLVGNVIVSVFADDAKRWSLPPFCVIIAFAAAVLLRSPEGPQSQFTWTYILSGAAVVAAGARALAAVTSKQGQAFTTVVALSCVVAAFVWTEYLRSHGEVDVTGRITLTPEIPVPDGGQIDIVIDDAPRRTHLRLTLTVEDAFPRVQSCVPETRLDVMLVGGGSRSVVEWTTPDTTVDLPLGGSHGVVGVAVTVHTDKGCLMDVSVATAALHG